MGPISAALLGMLTGIGGGMVRDILVSEVPAVFRSELYAVDALAGASAVVAGDLLGTRDPAAGVGAILCFGLRMISIRRKWHLPVAAPERATSFDEA